MSTEVLENGAQERYELRVDGELAGILEYRGRGQLRALTHTEVYTAFEGRGLGTAFIRKVLDAERAQGRHILPLCPFVKAFLARNPEHLDLVEPKQRAAFNLG